MPSHDDSHPHVRWTLVIGDTQTDAANDNHDTTHDADGTIASTLHRHGSPTPIRPRAPTPPSSSPTSSPSSSAADPDSDSDRSPNSPTSSPLRGRAPPILGPHHALVSRATARRRAGPSSIDFGPTLSLFRPAGTSTSTLPLPTPTDFMPQPADDALVEPRPPRSLRTPTLTDVLDRARTRTSTADFDLSTFGGHRDTFALLALHGLPTPAPALPPPIFARLAPLLDAPAYAAVRLTCRGWCAGLTAAAPRAFRAAPAPAQRLPAELLRIIYGELRPVDFNAARRTCRAWMVAGLEGGVLEAVLRRGGWWGGVLADREVRRERRRGSVGVEWEWVMGRRVASECAMGVGWTGCGVEDREEEERDGVGMRGGGVVVGRSGVKLTAVTDFAALAGEKGGEALQFTVSVCGKFLLVAHACAVSVYRLCENERRGRIPTVPHGGSLALHAHIVCPTRVLAVSMDTSSRRFAVAALLADRTGMVVDLARERPAPDEEGIPTQRRSIWGPQIGGMDALPSPEIGGEKNAARGDVNNVHVLAYSLSQHPQVNHVADHVAPLPSSPAASPLPQPSDPILAASAPFGPSTATTATTPPASRTVYPALCTPASPPLSVAICPQRRCVAFACATGIELHWVDALTGRDRRRWFPLAAPADFLYFLPTRRGVDSARKLRLISSAGGAGQRGSLRSRCERREWHGYGNGNGRGGMGERRESESAMKTHETSPRAPHHLKAIPLSDGETILSTDPTTALLTLGPATPSPSPLRTFTFTLHGPHGPSPRTTPTVYAAASDLRWGVRVVAAYASALYLFTVPPDWLAAAKDHAHAHAHARRTSSAPEGPPVAIPGVHVATVPGVCDLAVDAAGGTLTVWAFAAGAAYTFQLDGGARRALRRRGVDAAGNVVERVDGGGDGVGVVRGAGPVSRTTELDGAGCGAGEAGGGAAGEGAVGVSVSRVGVGERVVREVVEEGWEGDWSGEEGAFAVHVPAVEGRWSGESGEWEVDYLRGEGVVGGGWDLERVGSVACEIV